MFIFRRITQTSVASGLPSGIMLTLLIVVSLLPSHALAKPFARDAECEIAAISHRFEPGHHVYTMSGECYSGDEGTWDLRIDVEWFGNENRVHEGIQIGKHGGELWATCPADPVIDDDECSDVSYNGIYGRRLDDYTSVEPILQSREHVSDQQKEQISAALGAAITGWDPLVNQPDWDPGVGQPPIPCNSDAACPSSMVCQLKPSASIQKQPRQRVLGSRDAESRDDPPKGDSKVLSVPRSRAATPIAKADESPKLEIKKEVHKTYKGVCVSPPPR